MLRKTPLYDYHSAHARLTEFAGYEMPLWYTSTTTEHLAVRNNSGIFDVSHMGRFEVTGPMASAFLEEVVPTKVQAQSPGKVFYTLFLNDRGGIIDDLIIMKLGLDRYMVVVNAVNADLDMRHMMAHTPSGATIRDTTSSSIMIAVQGPEASHSLQPLTDLDLSQLRRFRCEEMEVLGQPSLISRTGYTGEDGFEIIVRGPTIENPEQALRIWEKLAATSTPCGLSSRDSLRLEAGFPLHGSDIDQSTDPFQADLSWVISTGKASYVGSDAVLEARTRPVVAVRRGLVLERGIPRQGFEISDESGPAGTITSGTFSPIVRKGIAQCRVSMRDSEFGTEVKVHVREDIEQGRITKPPFYDEKVYGWKRLSKGN
jgi:aminomethyltransferase